MTPTADQLVNRYLKRLDQELAELPQARRREVVDEISEHIAEARSDLETQNEPEIRNLLDRLGDPADIAAEARDRFGVGPKRSGLLEIAALILLLVGGIVLPVVGWLVGVALLWASAVWSTRDKLIGTLVVPGGLGLPILLLALTLTPTSSSSCSRKIDVRTHEVVGETCSGGTSSVAQILGVIVLVLLVLASIVTTAYLARRMRRGEGLLHQTA